MTHQRLLSEDPTLKTAAAQPIVIPGFKFRRHSSGAAVQEDLAARRAADLAAVDQWIDNFKFFTADDAPKGDSHH
jgi:hypothetical protein